MSDELEAAQPSINPITKLPWTDEDRELQRQRAKALVAEGKFGGKNHGRRKKKPAYAVIAAQAERHARELAAELIEIATTEESPKLRMDAIKMLVDIELKAKANQRDDEDHLLKMPEQDLRKLLMERIQEVSGEQYDIELDDDDVFEDDDDEDIDGD